MYVNLGYARVGQKKWVTAARACRKAVELDSGSVLGWTNLGLALANQGDKTGARDAWERAATLDPTNQQIQSNLATLR